MAATVHYAFEGLVRILMTGRWMDGVETKSSSTCQRLEPLVLACKLEFADGCPQAETFHSTSWFEANKTVHGSEGPLHVTPHEPCGISNLVLEAYQEKGFPIIHDVFTTGESPHACGHALRSIHKGTRSTAADYITSGNLKGQLSIVTNAYVEKMVLEEGPNGKRVAAVRLRDLSGKFTVIDVLKEAILSGGAYGSPAILIRSGIGPKAEVQKLGLECQIDCPGVGKNLMDHPVSSQYWNKPCLLLRLMVFSADGAQLVMVFYEVADPTLTTDHLVWHEGAKNKSLAQYEENKTGFLSKFPFGTFAFARLDDRLSNAELWHQASEQITVAGRDPMGLTGRQPHVEMWNTECYGPKVYGEEPGNDKQAFGMITTLFGARSRGEVTLNSLDPSANPVVDHKHFSDPLDLLVLAEGCRLANEIVIEGNATKDVIKGSWPERLTHHTYKERAEWEDYLKKNAGTCERCDQSDFLRGNVDRLTSGLRLSSFWDMQDGQSRR